MRERLKYQRKCYTIADYYISYKEYIEPNTQYDVDLKTFKAIVTDYFKYIKNEIIAKAKDLVLAIIYGDWARPFSDGYCKQIKILKYELRHSQCA